MFVARTADEGMSRSLSDAIAMMLETGAISLEELLDARILLEVPLAGLAAYQADEATVQRLREAIARESAARPAAPRRSRRPTPRSTGRSPPRPATG